MLGKVLKWVEDKQNASSLTINNWGSSRQPHFKQGHRNTLTKQKCCLGLRGKTQTGRRRIYESRRNKISTIKSSGKKISSSVRNFRWYQVIRDKRFFFKASSFIRTRYRIIAADGIESTQFASSGPFLIFSKVFRWFLEIDID